MNSEGQFGMWTTWVDWDMERLNNRKSEKIKITLQHIEAQSTSTYRITHKKAVKYRQMILSLENTPIS
jgi:hypothetical protein